MKPLSPNFVELTKDATLKAFWRKNTLKNFLRQHDISENELSTWDTNSGGETKLQYLERLFSKLIQQTDNKGYHILFEMAKSLSEMNHFPDLQNKEDTKLKVAEATQAISRIKQEYEKLIKSNRNEKEIQQRRLESIKAREKTVQQQETLDKLKNSMEILVPKLGTQDAGYQFEEWFYQLANFFDIDARAPYRDKHGRQIDGSITLNGTTYLVETKFTQKNTGTTDVDSFFNKILRKADNTMGIMLSMAGYDDGAKENASRDRTPILLLDYSHLYFIFSGDLSLKELIERVSRHASQTGNAYLACNDFSQ
jgi:hypothetical protein